MSRRAAPSIATLAILATLVTGTPALAEPQGPGGGGWGHGGPGSMAEAAEHRMEHLFATLHLTAEQRTRMQAIRKHEHDATTDTRKQLEEKRRTLLKLIRQPNATKDQALALQHDVDGLQAQLAASRLSAWFEARAVLTPQQLVELGKLHPPRNGRGHPPGPHK